MASRSALAGLAGLLLVARAAALLPPSYNLRNEHPPSSCGFADYGSAVGTAQRLVETHLTPGVADWNIVVPMPPPCVGAPMTGVEMRVCDGDTPPNVTLSDMRSARVHRNGQVAGFATVNVTVYCIIAPPTVPSPPSLDESVSDTMSAYDLSNELDSDEAASNKETSDEFESVVLVSTELATTVKPTSTTTLPPVQEKTTARDELTLPTVVTHQPKSTTHSKEKTPPSLKVTININPNNRGRSNEEDKQSYDGDLPLLSNKEKPNKVMSSHSPRLPSESHIAAPPRMSGMPPRKHVKRPRWHVPPQNQATGALGPPPYAAQFPLSPGAALPPYQLESPYPLTALYRPQSLLSSRLRFLQRRQPLLFFRHF